jgi:glycerophosphoryl diester phosphodiesterase
VVSLDEPTVDRVLTGPHRLVHPSHRAITAELLSRFHAAGIGVNVWTVDDPGDMARLAGWGVDGLCTNVPDVAVAVLANATGSATARPD